MRMNIVVMTKTSKTAERRPKLCIKGGNSSMTMLGQKKLKDAMKRHLYKNKFGSNALDNSHLLMKDYNPCSF